MQDIVSGYGKRKNDIKEECQTEEEIANKMHA